MRTKSGMKELSVNLSTEELIHLNTAFLKRGIGMVNAN